MPFDLSVTKPLLVQPWRWTTQPDAQGNGGVKETLTGAFVLMSDELFAYMRAPLSAAEKTELDGMMWRVSTESPLPAGHESAALWNIPMWSGTTRATYLRVPANVWTSATVAPPAQKIQRFLGKLYTV